MITRALSKLEFNKCVWVCVCVVSVARRTHTLSANFAYELNVRCDWLLREEWRGSSLIRCDIVGGLVYRFEFSLIMAS